MIKEIDKRNLHAFPNIEDYHGAASIANFGLTESGEGPIEPEINTWTGNLRGFRNPAPDNPRDSMIKRALDYLQSSEVSFGFTDGVESPSFQADPNINVTSAGESIVHLQQVYKGIPVFLVYRSVFFNRDKRIEGADGDNVNISHEVDINPRLSAKEALATAITYFEHHPDTEVETDGWGEPLPANDLGKVEVDIRRIMEFQQFPFKPTVLDTGGFAGYVPAHLVVFYIGPQAELGWYFMVPINALGLQYDVVISAHSGEVLYCQNTTSFAVAKGKVYPVNGGEAKKWLDFPLPRQEYPLPVDGAIFSFQDWVSSNETAGNNVVARLGETNQVLAGRSQDQLITFDPRNQQEEFLLNIFYFCNYMHDFFFLLGFDERAGCFQGQDPVIAKAHQGAIYGTANMNTPVDGSSPVMNMGLVRSSGRHTALDADVVFHEYVHGVTNRLVGGRINERPLLEEQSKAMGEGWGDYFALTIQNINNPVEKVVTGSWVVASARGIRSHAYDDDFDQFLTYGRLSQVNGEHARGELWCATLMHWTRHLSNQIGKQEAYWLCWQAIVDGLKLTNANPSFLDGRNAIARALKALWEVRHPIAANYDIALRQFWTSFAKFGMGIKARSNGPSVRGITEDFTPALSPNS